MSAPNTEEGLQIIPQLQPDAIIACDDARYDAGNCTAASTPGNRIIPVIIAPLSMTRNCLSLGASQYVSKPVTPKPCSGLTAAPDLE